MQVLSRTYDTSFDKEYCRVEKEIALVHVGRGLYTVIVTEKTIYNTPKKIMRNLNDAIEVYKQAGGVIRTINNTKLMDKNANL